MREVGRKEKLHCLEDGEDPGQVELVYRGAFRNRAKKRVFLEPEHCINSKGF